tara:strand:- start:9437 stop:10546 length:1110 start_codon:yes stop_codon:yes gene_type:complete
MIPVSRPLFIGNEKKYINECVDSTWIGQGEFNERFEKSFAEYIGKSYAISVSNGSVALDLCLKGLNLKKGDEVIVTNFTIISCISSIIRCGAEPVLVDIDSSSWNIDTSKIEEKISPKTKAIMAVHIYNLPVNMDKINELCIKHNLILIEDAAEQIGQTYKKKMVGSFGDVSCFSFYSNKNITCGEGGMILTDSKDLYEFYKTNRNLGFGEKRFIHNYLGFNYRMTNMQAAIGLAQLEKIEYLINIRKEIGRYYSNELSSYKEIIYYPPEIDEFGNENIYWVFAIRINDSINLNFEDVKDRLSKRGIEIRPFFYPLNMQPVFADKFSKEQFPNSINMYDKGFYIPCGNGITMKEAKFVVKELKILLNEF